MASKKRQTPAPLALRSRAEIRARAATLLAGQIETAEQADIVLKTETDLLRQRAIAAKEVHGQQVLTRGVTATGHNYVSFLSATDELRNQVQDRGFHSKADQFLTRLEEEHGNGLLGVHYIAEQKVQEVVSSPVDPPDDVEYILEEPGFFARLGGAKPTIKRVRR